MDDIGANGTVRLRCYLPLASSLFFAGSCPTCDRSLTVGVEAAIDLAGNGEVTIGELAARLRCRACGRGVDLMVAPDTRSFETRQHEGRLPETIGLRVHE